MADLSALFTSRNENYCTPPEVVRPMRRVLVPKGSGRRMIDPGDNGGSIVGAHLSADGIDADGLSVDWGVADCWYNNPEYGTRISLWTERQAYYGREVGVPGISLLPARVDTRWCREHIFSTADAWVYVDGRLTFWVPIPLDPVAGVEATDGGPYCLRRWHPDATADDLPRPFRRLRSGLIVGPELGKTGLPQSAPFPSLIAFWADTNAHEPDAKDELAALRELVRRGSPVDPSEAAAWTAAAERLRATPDDLPLRLDVLERLDAFDAAEHPIDVRTFAAHFLRLGTLTVARGRYRGVYRPK